MTRSIRRLATAVVALTLAIAGVSVALATPAVASTTETFGGFATGADAPDNAYYKALAKAINAGFEASQCTIVSITGDQDSAHVVISCTN